MSCLSYELERARLELNALGAQEAWLSGFCAQGVRQTVCQTCAYIAKYTPQRGWASAFQLIWTRKTRARLGLGPHLTLNLFSEGIG